MEKKNLFKHCVALCTYRQQIIIITVELRKQSGRVGARRRRKDDLVWWRDFIMVIHWNVFFVTDVPRSEVFIIRKYYHDG